MTRSLTLSLVSVVFASCAWTQEYRATLTGQVVDSAGAGIEDMPSIGRAPVAMSKLAFVRSSHVGSAVEQQFIGLTRSVGK